MSNKIVIKISKQNWSQFYKDATKAMFGCEPEVLMDFTPALDLYVFDYGSLSQHVSYFVGCELIKAKVEDKDGDIVKNVQHVYMNNSLGDADLIAIDEHRFELNDKSAFSDFHFFFNKDDIYSIYISEEAIMGMRVKEKMKEDMECRMI